MIEITGHVPPVQPGGGETFQKSLWWGRGVQKFLFWFPPIPFS